MESKKTKWPGSSDPRVLQFSTVKDWEENIEDEDTARWHWEMLQRKLNESNVVLSSNVKILEIGSGKSIFLSYLQKMGLDAIGVDARPRGEEAQNVVKARIEELPFPDETFELIISNAVFDSNVYRQDTSTMTGEIARVLKQDGVYIEYMNHDGNNRPIEHLKIISKSEWKQGITLYRKN